MLTGDVADRCTHGSVEVGDRVDVVGSRAQVPQCHVGPADHDELDGADRRGGTRQRIGERFERGDDRVVCKQTGLSHRGLGFAMHCGR